MSKNEYHPPELCRHPAPAVGIDVGADGLHICLAPQAAPRAEWQVVYLNYKEYPRWWEWVESAVRPGTVVAAEPTGWHYLAPVANILQQYTQADLWLVSHTQTGKIRDYRVSKQKTDTNDARALAVIALDIAAGDPPLGVWQHNQVVENHVLNLRFHVNAHAKLTTESTRLKNRLRQLGHGMFPNLGRSKTWRRCIALGAVTPEQIHALDLSAIGGHAARHIEALRRDLPILGVPTRLEQAAIETAARIDEVEQLIYTERQTIEEIIYADPFTTVTHRLMTVPCATTGWVAAIHVATHARADQMNEEQFTGCLGIYPQRKASGKKQEDRSAKKGYRPAMTALYLWTFQLTQSINAPNPVHTYFGGGTKNGGRKFVSTRQKLAAILSGVARSPEGYQEKSS